MKLNEQDLEQLNNLIIAFFKKYETFPFVEDLLKEYAFLFPENISNQDKEQIENLINETIITTIQMKNTKGWNIMFDILQKNEQLRKDFRKLNSDLFFEDNNFQKLWKQIEMLMMNGEDKLTAKMLGAKTMWISKVSESRYDMVYAIFPARNKIK